MAVLRWTISRFFVMVGACVDERQTKSNKACLVNNLSPCQFDNSGIWDLDVIKADTEGVPDGQDFQSRSPMHVEQ